MDVQKTIEYWLESAKKDWIACQHLYENKDYPQCLFWGHLVLEKLLKGLVVQATQEQAQYSHDLVFLASKGALQYTEEQRNYLNEINTFNQFGRYDTEIMNFMKKCTPEYTQKYFFIIQQLSIWLMDFYHNKQ